MEWVPSASNLVDDGSRRGSVEGSARALGIPIAEASFDREGLTEIFRATPVDLVASLLG